MLSLELGGNINRGALLHFPKTEVVILQYPKFHLQCKINNMYNLLESLEILMDKIFSFDRSTM